MQRLHPALNSMTSANFSRSVPNCNLYLKVPWTGLTLQTWDTLAKRYNLVPVVFWYVTPYFAYIISFPWPEDGEVHIKRFLTTLHNI